MYSQVYCRRTKKQAPAMAPRRAAKANVEVAAQGPDNVSDTSPRTGGSVPTWSSISYILQSELVNCSDSDDYNYDIVKDNLNTKYKTIVQSGMHLVATRPRLLPYYDMIRRALDHIDLPSRTIINDRQAMIGTFRPEHIQSMYKLPATSEYTYGKEFLEYFKKKECEEYDKTMPGLIKDWVFAFRDIQSERQGCVFDFFVGAKLYVCGDDDLSAFRMGGYRAFLHPVGTSYLSGSGGFLIQLGENALR
jgi:hypothetical protein